MHAKIDHASCEIQVNMFFILPNLITIAPKFGTSDSINMLLTFSLIYLTIRYKHHNYVLHMLMCVSCAHVRVRMHTALNHMAIFAIRT